MEKSMVDFLDGLASQLGVTMDALYPKLVYLVQLNSMYDLITSFVGLLVCVAAVIYTAKAVKQKKKWAWDHHLKDLEMGGFFGYAFGSIFGIIFLFLFVTSIKNMFIAYSLPDVAVIEYIAKLLG